jgi:hypothetical protein
MITVYKDEIEGSIDFLRGVMTEFLDELDSTTWSKTARLAFSNCLSPANSGTTGKEGIDRKEDCISRQRACKDSGCHTFVDTDFYGAAALTGKARDAVTFSTGRLRVGSFETKSVAKKVDERSHGPWC